MSELLERLKRGLDCPNSCARCREALEFLNRVHAMLFGMPFSEAPCLAELLCEVERLEWVLEAEALKRGLFLEEVRRALRGGGRA